MKFVATGMSGLWIAEPTPFEDERGTFARIWCRDEFLEQGINFDPLQANWATSTSAGTLRGMHYQMAPHAEAKLIRCVQGRVYDQVIDLRPDSVTFGQSFGIELNSTNSLSVFIPAGFAHGYLTLEANSSVTYQVSERYAPNAERGIRYNDPAFNLDWPINPVVVSDKDKSWPDFQLDRCSGE